MCTPGVLLKAVSNNNIRCREAGRNLGFHNDVATCYCPRSNLHIPHKDRMLGKTTLLSLCFFAKKENSGQIGWTRIILVSRLSILLLTVNESVQSGFGLCQKIGRTVNTQETTRPSRLDLTNYVVLSVHHIVWPTVYS